MTAKRKTWLSLLASAPAERVHDLWAAHGTEPQHTVLRAPEIGLVMTRGRQGGTGAAFNLGEVTVTRCSVQLKSGQVGHGYVQGRDRRKARVCALIDAAMQTDAASALQSGILDPLAAEQTLRRRQTAGRAEATRVDFFTMVRGEG